MVTHYMTKLEDTNAPHLSLHFHPIQLGIHTNRSIGPHTLAAYSISAAGYVAEIAARICSKTNELAIGYEYY